MPLFIIVSFYYLLFYTVPFNIIGTCLIRKSQVTYKIIIKNSTCVFITNRT
jgi:hypothetical protein